MVYLALKIATIIQGEPLVPRGDRKLEINCLEKSFMVGTKLFTTLQGVNFLTGVDMPFNAEYDRALKNKRSLLKNIFSIFA